MKRSVFFFGKAVMALACAAAMAFAGAWPAEGSDVFSDRTSLLQSGGAVSLPSEENGGLSTMAPPPFFGQGQQNGGSQQPQQAPGGWGQPQQPQQPQQPGWGQPQQPAADPAQLLQGAWAGSDGSTSVILMFMGQSCGIAVNNQQMYGTWEVRGGRLDLRFQNGKTLSYAFAVQGDVLILDGSMRLTRQPMPQQGGGQQPGWGQPAASPLEGIWTAQTPNGLFAFIFHGSQYRCTLNNALIEEGTFTLSGNQLHYAVTRGQNPGQRGVNTWQIQGSVLTIITPNGGGMQLFRQQ
jgi:hypothetical protein